MQARSTSWQSPAMFLGNPVCKFNSLLASYSFSNTYCNCPEPSGILNTR